MSHSFIPAGEILGHDCKVRSIILSADPYLPSGEYTFVDAYCPVSKCDCRKTIIQIFHQQKLVSIVNFGWENPDFYHRWMGSSQGAKLTKEMSGISIDSFSPDLVSPQGMLLLVKHLMDSTWISILKENYRLIKKTTKPGHIIHLPTKITRNAPCPCGSGKKYKHCCL